MLRGLKSSFELLFTDYSTKRNNRLRLRIHALPFPLFIVSRLRASSFALYFLILPLGGTRGIKTFQFAHGQHEITRRR